MTRAILLHGFAADRMTWVGTVPGLSGITVETPDLPGHGRALKAVGDGSLGALAAPIAEQLAEGEPAWLIGHSLGGAVALRLAAEAPEQVRGLVLVAPLGLGVAVDVEGIAKVTSIRDAEQMRAFLERFVTDPALMAPMVATYALGQLDRPGAREGLERVAASLPATMAEARSDADRVVSLGLPVTVIWGAEDRIVQPDRARIEALGSYVEIEGAGHIPHVEALKRVNVLIRERIGL